MKLADWRGSRATQMAFWSAAMFAFVMAIVPHPPEVPGEPGDKVQHMVAFATLAWLGSFAYPRAKLGWLLAALSAFGAFIEIVQAIPALHRDSDVHDWIADTAAVIVVLLIVHLLRRRD